MSSTQTNITEEIASQKQVKVVYLDQKKDTSVPVESNDEMTLQEAQQVPDTNQEGITKVPGKVVTSWKEWRQLQREIPTSIVESDEKLISIQNALSDYRLVVTGLVFKADTVDQEIWKLYNQIQDEIPDLKQRTSSRPLLLRSRSVLKSLKQSWDALLQQQNHLVELLSKAPEELEFHNKLQIVRQKQKDEMERIEENAMRIMAARKQLEDAIGYIDDLYKHGDHVTYGSRILRVDEAQNLWYQKLEQIISIEKKGIENPDEILQNIFKLKEAIREAPVSARWVRSIEEKFSELVEKHDLLSSYGKTIIPQNEIARTTVMMFEKIPKLWASGDTAEFERTLNAVEGFINYYDQRVQAELAIAERRRPGLQRIMPAPGDEEKLIVPQLTALTRSLINAVDARDRLMRGHSTRVTALTLDTARKLGWNEMDMNYLEIAALLHDVGKLSIPETILTKMTPLTNDEWDVIRRHPFYGAQIIKPIDLLDRIVPWIYHHQERYDGQGYPDHLTRKEIPTAASIISVAEAFSAITVDMPNRPALSKEEATSKIQAESGKQFDPEIVDVFTEVLYNKGP